MHRYSCFCAWSQWLKHCHSCSYVGVERSLTGSIAWAVYSLLTPRTFVQGPCVLQSWFWRKLVQGALERSRCRKLIQVWMNRLRVMPHWCSLAARMPRVNMLDWLMF